MKIILGIALLLWGKTVSARRRRNRGLDTNRCRGPRGSCRGYSRAAWDRARGEGRSRDPRFRDRLPQPRSEEHTSELQSLMRISYAVFCLKKKKKKKKERQAQRQRQEKK